MRIAVTGYGLMTAAGANAEECWDAFTNARTGIGENTIVPREGVTSDLAGQVRSLEEPEIPKRDRAIRLGVRALKEALERAGLDENNPYPVERRGLSLGTSLGGARSGQKFHRDWLEQGYEQTNRFDLIEYPLHATADALAKQFKLHGPRTVHSNACAAGAVAVVNGAEYLRDDNADVVIAGGVDPLAWLSFGGFSSLGVLSFENCAPYTRSDGITLGEGAGFIVLEPLDRARGRGAMIYAELLGYGLSADAYHPTAPDPRGRGALKAMDFALEMAGIKRADVDYVNGHGTGTPANDHGEMKTVRVLGGGKVPMSSTKSMTGHTLGAAGAVEAVVSVMTLARQRLHPTFVPADEMARTALNQIVHEGEIDIVHDSSREVDVATVLSNSFAFGGNNASLLFGAHSPDTLEHSNGKPAETRRLVSIAGVAALAGAADNIDQLHEAFATGTSLIRDKIKFAPGYTYLIGRTTDKALSQGLNPRSLRRLDRLSKLAVQAVHQVVTELGISAAELAETGLVFATSTGPLSTVEAFQRGLIVNGEGDSKLFPNTVMNAAAGHIAMTFGMRGPTATICSGATSGVSALHFGRQLVRGGSCERVIVVAADEANEALIAGYARFPGYLATGDVKPNGGSGIAFSESSIAIVLEGGDVEIGNALEIAGMGLTSDGSGAGRLGRTSNAWQRSFEFALKDEGICASDLVAVVSSACGNEAIDRLERDAIAGLRLAKEVPVLATKGTTGDLQSVSPLMGIPVAKWLLCGETLMIEHCPVSLPPREGNGPRHVLVSGYSVGGSFQAFVVKG